MMKKNNKECICCQVKYTYCPSCSDFNHLPRWMNVYHDENCRDIFNIISGYTHKRHTKEEAKELLKKCDLSKKYSFKENLKVLIDEILKEEFVKVNVEKNDITETNNVVEDVQKEVVLEQVEEDVMPRKKHYKNKKFEKLEKVEE